jgi:hypothetical protein
MFAIYSPIIALRSTLVNRLEGEGKEMVPETPLWQEFERDKTAKLDPHDMAGISLHQRLQ